MKKYFILLILLLIIPFTVLADSYLTDSVAGSGSNNLKAYLNINDTISVINFESVENINITGIDLSKNSDNSVIANVDYNTDTITVQFKGKLVLPENCLAMFFALETVEYINGLEYFDTSNVTNMASMFQNCPKLKELKINTWDTSNVLSFKKTFYYCLSLEKIELADWNVSSNLSFNFSFGYCNSLKSIDLSKWDTKNVTDMTGMFGKCSSIIDLDLSSFDTHNVTTMSEMFASCTSLENINLSSFNTSMVNKMSYMFSTCTSLQYIDLSYFDTSNVSSIEYMFAWSQNLKTIFVGKNWDITGASISKDMFDNVNKLSNFDSSKIDKTNANTSDTGYLTLKEVTLKNLYDYTTATGSVIAPKTGYLELTSSILDSSYTFVGNLDSNNKGEAKLYIKGDNIYISSPCKMYLPEDSKNYFRGLKINSIIGVDLLDTSRVTSMENIFYGDSNIIELDLSSWDTSNVITFKYAFNNNTKLQKINLSDWNLEKAINLDFMFMECVKLHEINVTNWDVSNIESWLGTFYNCVSLTTLDTSNWVLTNTKDMTGTFYCCVLLTELDTSKWKFGKVEKLYAVFQECNKLEYVDVSNWDVSNCNSLCYLFCRCYALKSVDVSKWDVSKVTAIQSIFFYCENLTEIDVSNWDTSNVTNMHAVFAYCMGLTKLDLSTWNTSKVTVFTNMFLWCENLEELDVSSFVAGSECSSVSAMFAKCKKIKKLDLSNFNVSEACTYNDEMFYGCESLESIYTTGDWHFGEIQVYGENGTTFFYNCPNLVGAIAYDPEKISYEYANTDTYFINYHVYSNTYKVDENTITYTGTFDINKLTYKTVTVKKEGNKLNVYKGDEVIKTYSLIEKVVKQEPKKEIIKEDIIIKSNNNKINNLSIGYELIKIDDNNYKAIVENNIKTITIRASLEDEKATINGLGTKNLLVGDNKFELTVIAENGDINTINILVNRKDLYYIETIDEALEQEDNKIEVTIKEETVLDKETINKIIESNKEVEIKFQEEDKVIYSWTFDNSKLDNIDSINTKITFETNNEKINDFNKNNGLVINIENKEKLPENTKLKVYVGDNFNKNEKVKIYSYDKENNEMILLDETILADEYIEIELGDSLEFLVIKDEEAIENKSNKILYIIISIIIIIGIILIIKKSKKD